MSTWIQFKRILKGERKVIDIWHYLVGNYRYRLYYAEGRAGMRGPITKHPLMRWHIWEQIKYRIKVMNKECYNNGSCIRCGCGTTELQMAHKTCGGNCYPPLLNKAEWERFKLGYPVDHDETSFWMSETIYSPNEITSQMILHKYSEDYIKKNKTPQKKMKHWWQSKSKA